MESNLEKNCSREQKMYCIYKHVFPNGKVYIGQTCQKPERRWRNGEGYVESVLLYNAIKKYCWERVTHELLYTNLSQDEANYLEKKLITDVYKSNLRENGYIKSCKACTKCTNGLDARRGILASAKQ